MILGDINPGTTGHLEILIQVQQDTWRYQSRYNQTLGDIDPGTTSQVDLNPGTNSHLEILIQVQPDTWRY